MAAEADEFCSSESLSLVLFLPAAAVEAVAVVVDADAPAKMIGSKVSQLAFAFL